MSSDAYVWVDLEFPVEPKDCMNRWKQSALDGGLWSDWGAFGVTPGVLKGYETVAAALAQAARHAALQRFKGGTTVLSVALGPTQVKVRASLDATQADWWHVLAVLARVAGPLLAYGEFGWAIVRDGKHEGFVVAIGEGASKARPMSADELRRLERHPAVIEIEAKRAVAAATAPAPLPVPTPRSPGARSYRRRPMSHAAPVARAPLAGEPREPGDPGDEDERAAPGFGDEEEGGADDEGALEAGEAAGGSAADAEDEPGRGEGGAAEGEGDEGEGRGDQGEEAAPPPRRAARQPRAAAAPARAPKAAKPAAPAKAPKAPAKAAKGARKPAGRAKAAPKR